MNLNAENGITIAANRNIHDQSGKILAVGPISLIAGDNVNMFSSNDVTNASEMQKSFAGVSITVQSSLISTGQQAKQAGSLLSGDNGIYGIAPARTAGVNGYKALQSIIPNPDTGKTTGNFASISITAGYSFSESSSESKTASTNGTALRQFATQNAALVDGLMANAAFAQSAGKLIQVEYLITVGGGAALPAAQELAAMCSLGAQACAAQANVIFQEIIASIPELGGTGVGLAGIGAIDKKAVDQALTKAAATGPLTSGGGQKLLLERFCAKIWPAKPAYRVP